MLSKLAKAPCHPLLLGPGSLEPLPALVSAAPSGGPLKKRGSETCIKLFNLCKYYFLGDQLGGKKQRQCTRPKHVEDVMSRCLCRIFLSTILRSRHGQSIDVSALVRQPKDRQTTFSVTVTGIAGHTHTVALGRRKHSSMEQLCGH